MFCSYYGGLHIGSLFNDSVGHLSLKPLSRFEQVDLDFLSRDLAVVA